MRVRDPHRLLYHSPVLLGWQDWEKLFIMVPESPTMAWRDATVGNTSGQRVRGILRSIFGVVLQRQTYRNLAYLLLAFPLGLGYFVVVTVGLSLGVGLAIIGVGFIILALTLLLALGLASIERRLTNALLDTDIEMRNRLEGDSAWERGRSVVLDRRTWTAILYLPVKFILGLLAFVGVVTGVSTAVAMMMVPVYYRQPGVYVGVVSDRAPEIHQTIYLGWNYLLVGIETAFTFGYWEIDTFPAALLVAVMGLLGILAILHVMNSLARVWGRYARWSFEGGFDLLGALFERSD